MKTRTMDLMRLWALLTGVVLAGWYFGALAWAEPIPELLPMLIAGIGGFELFFYGQDAARRRRRHG